MPAVLSSTGPITIGSTTIATLGWSFSPDIVRTLENHSGLPYPVLERVSGGNPRVRFRCYYADIHALTGLTILSATTFSVYLSKYTTLIRDASSTHLKLALAASCTAAIQIISTGTDQDGLLIAEVEAVILANASVTAPLAITTNNALPALTAAAVMHTLGPLVRNSTGIPGVNAAALSLNPSLMVERADGDLYPRVAAQVRGEPKLAVGHKDPRAVLAAFGIIGDGSAVTLVQYFRAYNATTGLAQAASGVSFTMASHNAIPLDLTTEAGGIATQGIEFSGLSSSTTHPVAVSLAATVPDAG